VRVLGGLHHILGVWGDEGAAVLGLEEGVDHDLLGLEVVQIDHGHSWIGLVVDEEVLAVVLALGLRYGRVMGIAVGDVLAADLALRQHRLGLVVEAVPLPGLGREDADVLQDTHRRDAVDDDLAGLTARAESQVLVPSARRRVGLGRRQQVLFGQPSALHDVLQRLDGPGRGRRPHRESRPDRQG